MPFWVLNGPETERTVPPPCFFVPRNKMTGTLPECIVKKPSSVYNENQQTTISIGGTAMLIPFSIIKDYLADLNPAFLHRVSDELQLSFEDVRLTYSGQTEFDPQTLYILNGTLSSERTDHCTFLVIGQPEQDMENANLITLDCSCSPEHLCDHIGKYFITLKKWTEQMDLAIIKDGSLQTLIDISDHIIKNPMLLLDSSFNCQACSGSITESDYLYYDVKTNGKPSADTIYILKQNSQSRNFTYGKFRSGKNYRISVGPTNEQELFTDFLSDDSFILGLNLRFSKVPLSQGQIDLIGIFVEKLQLKKLNFEKNTGEISFKDFLFPLLLRGDPEAIQLAESFTPFQNAYMILTTNSNMTRALANEIRAAFSDSYLFSFKQIYYIFIPVELYNEEKPYYIHKIEQQLNAIGQRYSVIFGVSGPVCGHKWLNVACEQALRSIELSDDPIYVEETIPFLKLYRHIALIDMLTIFFKEHPLSSFAPMAFLAMRKDDAANETEFCSFIKTYILNNCNSARTAKEIYLHKNSVSYRVEKLRERYHIDFDNTYDKLLFLLSYIADMHS